MCAGESVGWPRDQPRRRARHRWPIERTNAWAKSMRRIATRYDGKPDSYLAFLQIAMIVILIRHF
jgi:transposase